MEEAKKASFEINICVGQTESPQKLEGKRTGFITPRRPKEKQNGETETEAKVNLSNYQAFL